MAEAEDGKQAFVKAQVSKVIRSEIMKSIRRWTVIEAEAGCLGSDPASNIHKLRLAGFRCAESFHHQRG